MDRKEDHQREKKGRVFCCDDTEHEELCPLPCSACEQNCDPKMRIEK